ncbi:uncharacterized protein [Centruroides vittatus]|uniref:uncharacterized protein n=1 Tax=Centruroides vittatus TaxID=120091 RepID=UPI0035103E5C
MKRFKTYLKISVMFVNQVLFLLGLIVLVSSIILKDDIEDIEDLLDEQVYNLQNIPILLPQFSFKSLLGILTASIISGIVVIVVSFVGCYGAYYESILSLKFHLIFSSIATLLDFIVLLVLFVETRKMQSTIDKDICDLIICPPKTEYLIQTLSTVGCISLLIIGITKVVIIFHTFHLYLHLRKPPPFEIIYNRSIRHSNSSAEHLTNIRRSSQQNHSERCSIRFIPTVPSAPPEPHKPQPHLTVRE